MKKINKKFNKKMTSNIEYIQWRVPSIGALLIVLVFLPHLFSKAPYVNAGWVPEKFTLFPQMLMPYPTENEWK
jgi:hypothetical protein